MKKFTVKEISELLDINPETVRRWIRSGKLSADQTSRKDGNFITEEALKTFLEHAPKYISVATASLFLPSTVGISALAAVLFSEDIAQCVKFASNVSKNTKEDAVSQLEKEISAHKKSIEEKQVAISKIQEEIDQINKKVNVLTDMIDSIKKHMV